MVVSGKLAFYSRRPYYNNYYYCNIVNNNNNNSNSRTSRRPLTLKQVHDKLDRATGDLSEGLRFYGDGEDIIVKGVNVCDPEFGQSLTDILSSVLPTQALRAAPFTGELRRGFKPPTWSNIRTRFDPDTQVFSCLYQKVNNKGLKPFALVQFTFTNQFIDPYEFECMLNIKHVQRFSASDLVPKSESWRDYGSFLYDRLFQKRRGQYGAMFNKALELMKPVRSRRTQRQGN